MKTVWLFLITLAVTLGPAYTLRCHVCTNTSNCKQPQSCPSSSRYCKTVTSVESLAGNLVKKTCEDSCIPSHSQQGHQVSSGAESTQCCQEDLCNVGLNSATSAGASLNSMLGLVLILTLGFFNLLLAANL
ncbi:lymphocyte antigen 6D [Fukomys damarensis]|nr:lymphocyte antigen 6D [Fukomys damarensis]